MTQAANYNADGARQCVEYVTIVIDATEFSGVSATASTLDLCVLPPGAIVIDVGGNVETVFNGANDQLDIGIGADADALAVAGSSNNLGTATYLAFTPGVQHGEKLTSSTTVTATYTPSAAAASSGSVRVNLGYIIADRAESIYDG